MSVLLSVCLSFYVCCDCCVLSGWGLCDELITHQEESYRLWCVMCDLETSGLRKLWPTRGCWAKKKNKKQTKNKQTNKQTNDWLKTCNVECGTINEVWTWKNMREKVRRLFHNTITVFVWMD
jgi:hypothetical protein